MAPPAHDQPPPAAPDHAEALRQEGMARFRAGDAAEALAKFREAVRHDPASARASNSLGIALRAAGALDEAIAAFTRAASLTPDYAEAYSNLGAAQVQAGHLAEAEANLRQAVTLRPELALAHYNLGSLLATQHRHAEAIESFNRALALDPGYPEAHNNRGEALSALGRNEEAVESYRRALALNPDLAEAHNNLGEALQTESRFEEAAACFRRAIAIRPELAAAHSNLGLALYELGRLEEAMVACQRALALEPELPEAHLNLGVTQKALGAAGNALASYERAIALRPDYADAHWNKALGLLLAGDYARGWEEYEWRWKCRWMGEPPRFTEPLWDGEDLAGRTILLYAEQGMGDTIQFLRYVPHVAARGARIVLEVYRPLVALAEVSFPTCRVIGAGSPRPAFDRRAPLLSLPRLVGTTVDTIPARVPYLAVDSAMAERWSSLRQVDGRLRVGLVWAGNPAQRSDRERSVPIEKLAPILGLRDVCWFSLQVGGRSRDLGRLGHHEIVDLSSRLVNYAETAGAIANLDLVLTVDTSVAHLAGALGISVWVMLWHGADWRYGRDATTSPWYPTMRLFRQPRRGDWEGVAEMVYRTLETFPGGGPEPSEPPA